MKGKKSIILNILLIATILIYIIIRGLNYYIENYYQCFEEGYTIKDGKSVNFYPNGAIESEGELIDCHVTGVYKIYYENGKLKSIGLTKNGDNIGIWQTFDLDGNLINAIYYNKSSWYNIPLDSLPR